MNAKKTEPIPAPPTPPVVEDPAKLRELLRQVNALAVGLGAASDYIERRMAAILALTKPYA